MIEILKWDDLSTDERKNALKRASNTSSAQLYESVSNIISSIKREGDSAVRSLTAQFDKYDAAPAFVPEDSLRAAAQNLSPDLRSALDVAITNITNFHILQKPTPSRLETMPGVVCEMQWRPIEKVGLYVPGGLAPLFSTVLMLALPAKIAGCIERIICTPPSKDGTINQGILAAAYLCGIKKVLPIGGAQAIAAMAFGTETIPKVDKIYGPGNSFVTMAKQLVSQDPDGAAIDMPAGPSEAMVVADGSCNPIWVAADVLAQAEHGKDSQSICITTNERFARDVKREVEKQTAQRTRLDCINASLENSRIIVAADISTALEIANLYAPEHLILHGDQAPSWVDKIQHAGSVFVGSYSPETSGDYASGTNHVLPTYGYARAYGGLSLLHFMKNMTVQTLSRDGLATLAPSLIALAKAEGLDAHAAAVEVRSLV